MGLVKIEELGTLESIIALTNTLNVGLVHDAVVDHMIEQCKKDNIELESINPNVFRNYSSLHKGGYFYCEYNKVPGTHQQSSIALMGGVPIT